MATKTYAKIAPLFAKGVQTYQWSGMATGDDGLPALDVMRHTKKTLQAEGTVTSVPIQGRIDGGAWVTLVTLTTAGIIDIPQDVDDIRPVVTTGAAVIITLQVVAPSRALSGTTSLGGLVPLPGGGFSFPTGQILAPDGSVSAPSYSFVNDPNSGMYSFSDNILGFAIGGGLTALMQAGQFSVTQLDVGLNGNVLLNSDAAGILAQRNGVNAQTFRLYNTFTNASNGEWLEATWAGNNAQLRASRNGTGVARPFQIQFPDTNVAIQVPGVITTAIILAPYALTVPHGGGRVNVGGGGSNTGTTTGPSTTFHVAENFVPTATSSMIAIPVKIAPTINYSNGTPGAGSYEAIKIAVIETALPTGQSYMIRASGGAAGTTDVFAVLRDGITRIYTDAANYLELYPGVVSMVGGSSLTLRTTTGAGSLSFGTNGIAKWTINTGGVMFPLADNTYDFGWSGGRIKNLYLAGGQYFAPITAPATPGAGTGVVYMKADKKLYFKDDAGVETALW